MLTQTQHLVHSVVDFDVKFLMGGLKQEHKKYLETQVLNEIIQPRSENHRHQITEILEQILEPEVDQLQNLFFLTSF